MGEGRSAKMEYFVRFTILWTLLAGGMLSSCFAYGEEGSERPGLVGIYEVGEIKIERIDETIGFRWGLDRPDERLPAGRFRGTWRGVLFVPQPGKHRFRFEVQGEVRLRINQKEVLSVASDSLIGSESGVVDLSFGNQAIEIDYRRSERGGELRFLWSSESFEWEPVPATRLYHLGPSEESGSPVEELLAASRCASCHALPTPTLASPSLQRLKGSIHPDALEEILSNGHRLNADLSSDEVRQVAGYLLSASDQVTLPIGKSGDVARGQERFESLGCLACHRVDGIGSNRPLAGGDLSRVGAKRPAGFFRAWLTDPASLQAEHRMPTMELAPEEVNDLTAYLSSLGRTKSEPAAEAISNADLRAGYGLVKSHRCAQCHAMKEIQPVERLPLDGSTAGCLGNPDRSRHRPGYRFSDSNQKRLLTYVRSLRVDAQPISIDRRGEAILAANNCRGCHARGHETGLREVLAELGTTDAREQSVRSAPTLEAVGDKLQDAWLKRAILGEAPRLRPWLAPRMPRFRMKEKEIGDLTAYLIAHDRMPTLNRPSQVHSREEELVAAQRLVGPAGFGCMSCHQVGKHLPVGGEPSARGPDIAGLDQRVRFEWYRRWTRNPARIAGGVEMPAINLASPGLLSGDLESQLAALWVGLNSPGFQVPALQAVQSLSAIGGKRPIVLRDLVEHGPKDTTARPLGVGLTNGHSILIDLDRMSLRAWWMGDFAQEQTRGKSWYWTTAGIRLADLPSGASLLMRRTGAKLEPIEVGGEKGLRLGGWKHEGEAVIVELRMHDRVHEPIRVDIRVQPTAGGVRLVFSSTEPSLVVAGPMPARFDTPAGPASLSMTGGQNLLDTPIPARQLTEEVAIEWRLERSIEAVSAIKVLPPSPPALAKRLPILPGYEVERLSLPDGPMPTAMVVRADGSLLVASLKGGVFSAIDTDRDGTVDTYRPYSDELAAPFGLWQEADSVLAVHKHELLRLIDRDRDDFAERVEVVASGWGVTPDYHDWMVGPIPDGKGQYFLAASCQQDKRSADAAFGRGKLLRTTPTGGVEVVAAGLRFPMGFTSNAEGDLFASDNQGVTNPFNEINHLRPGKHFGFFNATEKRTRGEKVESPAIEIPHPWTGSVNGLSFIPAGEAFGPFAGQMIGAEYTTRRLVRMSFQAIGETYQGCVYPFGEATKEAIEKDEAFLGPISVAFGPNGTLYVGSMIDSGWGGGNNRGAIERVRFTGSVPFGIREVRAIKEGFEIDFTRPVDRAIASDPASYSISSYRRVPKGGYHTPDSDRSALAVREAGVSEDGKRVRLSVDPLRIGFVHEVTIGGVRSAEANSGDELPYPATAYFTLRSLMEND
jgi:glucose/arabinose dehydrogenase/mono/diheme cytochrome c family protein